MKNLNGHQYIERQNGTVRTEQLFGDRIVFWLYNPILEHLPTLFNLLTSRRISYLLGYWFYDLPALTDRRRLMLFNDLGINIDECCAPPHALNSYRKVFERQIRYWHCRPLPRDTRAIVSPADARVLIGSLLETSNLFIKEKFFGLDELLGGRNDYLKRLASGDFAVFRLTPDKYHYNHFPVSGRVADHYELEGTYHCCNPSAPLAISSILSKNKRTVTIIDTDTQDGDNIGIVAMIEIVALMIGDISQSYSEERYRSPRPLHIGQPVKKGAPKSLFRPGSSTVVLLFEPDRIVFSDDLQRNRHRRDVRSRFSDWSGRSIVETEVMVRSMIGREKSSF